MTNILRLKKNIDFKRVYKYGKSVADKYVVIYYNNNKEDFNRVGYTASKKVGKSVIRNRARRYMKESFRLIDNNRIKKGYDIVFIARVSIKNADFHKVKESMIRAMEKSGILH